MAKKTKAVKKVKARASGTARPTKKVAKAPEKAVKLVAAKKNPQQAEASVKIPSLVGKKAAQIVRPATGDKNLSIQDFAGQKIVLYFYPKDNTPGCTTEGRDFARLVKNFATEKTVILGVSRDSVKSHLKFKSQCGFPFDLLADEDESLCRAFNVIQEKSLYGRKYMGVDRSTFVIDERGVILREWRSVKVTGHADEVLAFVKSL